MVRSAAQGILLYLVFAIDVAILCIACRWCAGFKAGRPRWWTRYI